MTVNKKISDYSDGGALQSGDLVPIVRNVSGVLTNYTVQMGSLLATADFITQQVESGTTYTLTATDGNKVLDMTNSAGATVTIPYHTVVNIPVGSKVFIRCNNTVAALVQIAAGNDGLGHSVTIQSANGYTKINTVQYSMIECYHIAEDVWHVKGDLTA